MLERTTASEPSPSDPERTSEWRRRLRTDLGVTRLVLPVIAAALAMGILAPPHPIVTATPVIAISLGFAILGWRFLGTVECWLETKPTERPRLSLAWEKASIGDDRRTAPATDSSESITIPKQLLETLERIARHHDPGPVESKNRTDQPKRLMSEGGAAGRTDDPRTPVFSSGAMPSSNALTGGESPETLRRRLDSAQKTDDAPAVLGIRMTLVNLVEFEEQEALDRDVAGWFTGYFMRILKTGRAAESVDLLEGVVRELEPFADVTHLRAALPMVRTSAGRCPQCGIAWSGSTAECGDCLARRRPAGNGVATGKDARGPDHRNGTA
jgi:hypothetical protein